MRSIRKVKAWGKSCEIFKPSSKSIIPWWDELSSLSGEHKSACTMSSNAGCLPTWQIQLMHSVNNSGSRLRAGRTASCSGTSQGSRHSPDQLRMWSRTWKLLKKAREWGTQNLTHVKSLSCVPSMLSVKRKANLMEHDCNLSTQVKARRQTASSRLARTTKRDSHTAKDYGDDLVKIPAYLLKTLNSIPSTA